MRNRRQLSWRAAAGARLRRLVARALSWQRVAAALVIALFLGLGYAGYVVGTPDVDFAAVRSTATAEGRAAGATAGAKAGYARGYESARGQTYVAAYAAAFREAYAREFERAGLDPPQRIQVPDPR